MYVHKQINMISIYIHPHVCLVCIAMYLSRMSVHSGLRKLLMRRPRLPRQEIVRDGSRRLLATLHNRSLLSAVRRPCKFRLIKKIDVKNINKSRKFGRHVLDRFPNGLFDPFVEQTCVLKLVMPNSCENMSVAALYALRPFCRTCREEHESFAFCSLYLPSYEIFVRRLIVGCPGRCFTAQNDTY